MPPLCYFNGRIIPVADACVGVDDIGLLRGFGIYEALTTYNRKPFMLADHFARFRNSARNLSLKIPATDEAITSAINKLVASNVPQGKEAVIRFILTGGKAIGGIDYDYEHPTFYILVGEFEPLPKKYYKDGCSLIIFEEQRQFAGSKTTNYIQAVLLQKEKKKAGALDILYISDGKVLEAATSNFFITKNGVLLTPTSNVLPGITRKVTIDLTRPHFKMEERDVTVDEMYAADEAFITSSFKEVVPVVTIGLRTIGNGRVGEVTKRVMELFHAFTRSC